MSRTVREVFDAWARDYHADGMEEHHWPAVRQAFQSLPSSEGNYLEIGVGNGYGIRHMATRQFARGRCWGVELSSAMARRARESLRELPNVSIECADFLAWDPPAGVCFDLIFSMEVFYYFPDIQSGIHRAVSLLAPGGTLMVLVNFYDEHAASHSWPRDLDTPMTLWSARQYRDGFARAGLKRIRQVHLAASDDNPGTLCTGGVKET